ncbi:PH domain-containing protein [Schaalia sp. 19OD2882]|uniref:PH domain-containing protein n=1 Tax=Schaalia sp. 19OD2882 TaxID=2794089 RepID=UPI001C1EB9FE|nr:PH domain-containing protein [Schaalia sp. 19OD2882]QWW19908.1 PH domain-containing protein [Schaalia sp. 19OD2882]
MSATPPRDPGHMENPEVSNPTGGMPAAGADGAPSAAPTGGTPSAVPAEAWQRVHPISPVLETWRFLAALLAFTTYQFSGSFAELSRVGAFDSIGVGVVAVGFVGALALTALVGGVWAYFLWRATTWAVTPEAVWYRTGIVFKRQKQARLDRIQAVDVVHPLLGRLFGLGRLNIEVAGGANSNFAVGFLKSADLAAARARILALAAGLDLKASGATPPAGSAQSASAAPLGHTAPAASGQVSSPVTPGQEVPHVLPGQSIACAQGAADPNAALRAGGPGLVPAPRPQETGPRTVVPVAPEQPLYDVPPGRLIASLATSGTVTGLLVFGIALVGFTVWATFQWGPHALNSMWGVVGGVLGVGSYLWGRFAGEFNFRVALSPDGIRIRRGLLEVRSQTIPPRRIHAVKIEQGLVWRLLGWYRVVISQAGYGKDSKGQNNDQQRASDVLLPVGTRAQAEYALWLVVPELGVDDPRAFIDAAFTGTREGGGFHPVPDKARILDPFAWARRAFSLTRTCVVVRDGWLHRTVTVAPVERLQSVQVIEGPLMRKFEVVDLHMHVVDGSAKVHVAHLDKDIARSLLADLLALSQVRRVSEPPEKWMRRVSAHGPIGGAGGS